METTVETNVETDVETRRASFCSHILVALGATRNGRRSGRMQTKVDGSNRTKGLIGGFVSGFVYR